jgi:LysM repeat protein
MRLHRYILIPLALLSLAAGRNEDRVKRLPGATRKEFESFQALSVASLEELNQATAPARLEQQTREILALGNLSLGSRGADLPLQQYLRARLSALATNGVEFVGALKGLAMVPVTLPGTVARVGDQSWPLRPLWPNGVMPSLCPTNGVTGPLVDVGRGEWADIEGKQLLGAVALMEFDGGRNWERLYANGVRAVIVVESGRLLREKAEGLFLNTPVPCPRFYVERATGDTLRRLVGQTCRLEGGAVYAQRPVESLFAYLPPTPPVRHTVREGETLDAIAARYGVKTEELAAANRTGGGTVAPGKELTVPNAPGSLVVLVPIDTVNVVPDAPHGAKVAGNLAVALTALEHLATSPTAVRRKGLIVGFLDGEHVGGLASRAIAENFIRTEGTWTAAFVEDRVKVLERYRAIAGWFGGGPSPLTEEQAQWLGEQWLRLRLDEQRISLAEKRAAALQHGAAVAEVETKIERLVKLNQATIGNRRLAWTKRVEQFRAAFREPASAAPLPVTWVALRQRFEAELNQEEARAAHDANNLALAKVLRDKIGGKGGLGFQVDLGDATGSMLITDGSAKLRDTNVGSTASKFGKRFRDVIAFATVQGGWAEEWPFLIGDDRTDVAFAVPHGPMFYSDFWGPTGLHLFPLCTANDALERLDTPADLVERLNFKNLGAQARTALVMWKLGLESPVDSLEGDRIKKKAFGRLVGRCVQFNVRSGIDAQQPVPESLVYYPALPKDGGGINSAVFRGCRRGIIVPTLLNGTFALPVETLEWNSTSKSKPNVYAYHLNRAEAQIDMVVDRGRVGTQQQRPDFKLLLNQDVEKKLVLTEVRPLVFFPGVDPTDYKPVGKDQLVKVQDAVIKGEPPHYAYDNPTDAYNEEETDSNILYLPAGRRAQFIVRKGNVYKLLLVGDVADATPEGGGLLVDGTRLTLPLTPLVAARQMYDLALRRQALYRRFGITDQVVAGALERAGEKLQATEKAVGQQQWQEVNGRAREAWGILVKYYPRIMTMGRQAVFSAVLLMAFLLPASAFAEKLLVGGKGIIARLVGTTVIFALGVVLLNFLHPAFRISVSPFIIVIAYTMILMSSIVLVLCYQRFEVVVRRARAAGGEVESEEISLVSSLSTALALGVSNLKKRKTRTFLTAFTVTALTFSIVTFVSVKGTDALLVRQLDLDRDIEGQMVEPVAAKYQGVLLREFFWAGFGEGLAQAVESEFGTHFQVARRAHYLEAEGGNNAESEGINQVEIRTGKKSAILLGIMAYEPQEREFSHLHETVSGQQWFTKDDLFHCILPDNAAADLGITEANLLNADGTRKPDDQLPQVRLMNRTWRVIGILNTSLADRYRDINGKSLAMIDYLRSAYTPKAGTGDLANETPGYHISWRRLVIVPIAAKTEVQARLRSVAVRFPAEADTKTFYRDLALRVNRAVFGTVDGKLSLITTKQKQSVGGVAKILVPVILAILIVTNTMLGAVEERKGEVGMLGAIGLSPAQISFLLLSESLVFSVIGIVCGTFSGLAFANFVPWVRVHLQPEFLVALSLNFASLTAIGLALGTGVVVLLATLFPAKKAARLAAPSGMEKWKLPDPSADGQIRYTLPFTLTRGNAVGMIAFFRRFLLNHTEATSQDFNCRQIRLARGAALVVRCTMWLQPYDLDVAQEFEMQIQPTENAGIFAVALTLHRTSGAEEAWLRTNYGFLDLVRRQFLLWRNLDDASRKRYIEEGVELFKETQS